MLFGLVLQIIGDGGKEGSGALEAALDVTAQHVLDEVDDVESACFVGANLYVDKISLIYIQVVIQGQVFEVL